MSEISRYVLVTPVRDEESTVERTLAAVLEQTRRPAEWIWVSDGSTDRTNALIEDAAARNPWIRLIALPPRQTRSFAAVVRNTELGVRALQSTHYEFLGLLDADVTFEKDYFECLMVHFDEDTRLGLAGGVVIDVGRPRDRFPRNRRDVPGAVQFFRRACWDAIGGLVPIPEGGWDGMTCAMARMHGYETKLCTELVVDHLKPRNVAEGGQLRRKWQMGMRDYAAGYHPLFEGIKCISRWAEPPWLVGACAWWVGYCCAAWQRRDRVVAAEVVEHVRREQWERIQQALGSWIPRRQPISQIEIP